MVCEELEAVESGPAALALILCVSVFRKIKRGLFRLIRKAGLTEPAYRVWERLAVARAPKDYDPPDGIPMPPSSLQIRVVGHANPDRFLLSGLLGKVTVSTTLARHANQGGALLDFGCGCGRTARFFRDWPAELHGCDYNSELVDWCQANLPFMDVRQNRLEPPLPYDAGRFEAVYALSVWTHLRGPSQQAWMAEMHRVIKPGGLLLFTTQSDHFRQHLVERTHTEALAIYDAGELVVSDGELEGKNFCVAYAPPSWVRRELLDGWEEMEHVPEGSIMTGRQDLWVVDESRYPAALGCPRLLWRQQSPECSTHTLGPGVPPLSWTPERLGPSGPGESRPRRAAR